MLNHLSPRLRPSQTALVATGVALAALALFGLVYALSPQPPVEPLRPEAVSPSLALPAVPTATGELAAAEPAGEPAQDGVFAGISQAPAPPPPRTETISYEVVPGDVLWEIAERFGLRSETLLWANDEVRNPDLLLVGQKLLVPPVDGVFYTVRPGEHLADVAVRYGVDLEAIARANKLTAVDQVQWGVDLFLPGARPLRPAVAVDTASQEALVVAPESPEAGQQSALAIPPIPLPANIEVLLQAGWLRAEQPTALFRGPEQGARRLNDLPAGARLERIDGFKGGRIQVRDPGDGRTRQAMTGWVSAMDLQLGRAPATWELPQAYPRDAAMNIAHVFAPYRTQLDGSRYAEANCGPTTIGMALEAFGISVPSGTLRTQVLNTQRIWGNDVGTLITALAQVVESHGLTTLDLYAAGGGLYRWSLDDIREQVAAGRPVVVQVRYRALPGRGAAPYYGDHYILVTGTLDDGSFLYNDSINHDGLGWDRVISGDRLRTAMSASATAYAYSAFAVTR